MTTPKHLSTAAGRTTVTDPTSRRSALAAAGSALTAAVAGCVDGSGSPTTTTVPSGDPDALSLSATATRQASADGPPRFRVTLTNEGSAPVLVRYGQTLTFGADSLHQPPELVIVPAPGPGEPAARTDGCWYYSTGETTRTVTALAIARRETLAPGEALTDSLVVYASGATDACYPPGTYRYGNEVRIGDSDDGRSLSLAVTIEFAEDGTLSVRADDPAPVGEE